MDEHKFKYLGCGSALSKSSCLYHVTYVHSGLFAKEDVVKWCAAGWALAQKETEPDAHFCAVALDTGAGQKAATTQRMVRSKRTVALVEHKENVSVDSGRQHVTCWRQAFVKVDADGNFVRPLVASLFYTRRRLRVETRTAKWHC